MQTADNDNVETPVPEGSEPPRKMLSPAAKRALAEAEERRKNARLADLPPEIGGRGGAEPPASATMKSTAVRSISR